MSTMVPRSACPLVAAAAVAVLGAGPIAAPAPSAGAMEWDGPTAMVAYYAANFPYRADGGSAAHTITRYPWPQILNFGDAEYEVEFVQLLSVREDATAIVQPTGGFDAVAWRQPTPAEIDGVSRLAPGGDVVALMAWDRPRVLGALRNGPYCAECHEGTEPDALLGVLSVSLLPADDTLPDYRDLVDLLETLSAVDADTLRWAYSRWERYHPGGSIEFDRRRRFQQAAAEGYAATEEPLRADLHTAMAEGLLQALMGSGDGSPGRPYVPVTLDEIADVLDDLGKSAARCEPAYRGGESYRACGIDGEPDEDDVWFQTTLLDEWIGVYGR